MIEISNKLMLEYCRNNNLFPLIIETDSLAAMKMAERVWNRLWEVTMEVRMIHVVKKKY